MIGRFCPDEGVVAGYDNQIRVKYTAKWSSCYYRIFRRGIWLSCFNKQWKPDLAGERGVQLCWSDWCCFLCDFTGNRSSLCETI